MKVFFAAWITLMTFSASAVVIERVNSYSMESSGISPNYIKLEHPEPRPGQKIVVINMKEVKESPEEEMKLEIVFSKKEVLDNCNDASYEGKLVEKTIPNHFLGYQELTVGDLGMTLMYCGEETAEREVSVATGLELVNVNDNLVFYVPQDVEVSYRVWKPGKKKKVE